MIRAVLGKELTALWASPLPYVAGASFHVVLGVLVVNQLEVRGQAVTQPMFPLAGFLLLFVLPVLTMRTLAGEIRSGSLELIQSAGVPARPIVIGKWLAVWATSLVVIAPAGVVVVLLEVWGDPDLGPAVTGFGGLAVLASTLAAFGVMVSSLTGSQAVAAVGTIFGILILWFAHTGSSVVTTGSVLAWFSLSERMRTFAGGGIDTADLTYFGCATALALLVATAVVDLRRLR